MSNQLCCLGPPCSTWPNYFTLLPKCLVDTIWLAGVPYGGSHLAAIVAMFCPPMDVLLIRKEIKDHGTQKDVEWPANCTSGKVILFEDVITTGQSVLNAAKILEEWDLDIVGIVAVVDRRADTTPPTLGDYGFRALVDFEELIDEK